MQWKWPFLLLFSACYAFEWPETYVSAVDAGVDGGVVGNDGYTSCPSLAGPVLGDGGVSQTFDHLTLSLPTSIGLVDFPSAIPVGCVEPAVASAVLSNGTAIVTQPFFTWSSVPGEVLTVDATSGVVTGASEGVATLTATALGKTGSRTVWVGGDAELTFSPLSGYQGFDTPLHATATAGVAAGGGVRAHFSMRKGSGFDAVERSLVIQTTTGNFAEGQLVTAFLTYREFGETLPRRVRDYTGTINLTVEVAASPRYRFVFQGTLAGPNGSTLVSGHLEFLSQ